MEWRGRGEVSGDAHGLQNRCAAEWWRVGSTPIPLRQWFINAVTIRNRLLYRSGVSKMGGMKSPIISYAALGLVLASLLPSSVWPAEATDSQAVKNLFKKPPREYSSGPLWVWNDMLTEQQIVSTMRDLAGQQVKQVFVHPRPGLMTPYLAADWFRLWRVALQEAKRLDMNVWIYDENSYPSGFAGGLVPEAMPESRGRGLVLREQKTSPAWTNSLLAVYGLADNQCSNVTDSVRSGATLAAGRYLVASISLAPNNGWHGGKSYVDLLRPGVTEKFLDITLGAYRREIGGEFGKRVPGIFTDEPNIRPAGGLPWTESLPQTFQKRWGYSITDHLPSLHQPIGDWRRVRHDYYQLLMEQFIEHWGKPYHDYCATNHLELTGHYWEHDWPSCLGVPDNMAMYAWHQRPAIDILMNQYREDVHAQFGNARAVKELSSVANQLGLRRTLCEAYGAGGWDLRFEDMKRIGDWLYVLGVNTLDQHLSYVTLRGARKRDHPQSFSYHEPWWEAYHVSGAYFERLSAALSQGQQVNSILVLEPTTTAWMYNSDGRAEARLGEIGNSFQSLIMSLEKAQVEYDIGCEDIMARHGSVASQTANSAPANSPAAKAPARSGGWLTVGQRQYSTLVLPPNVENLNGATMTLLEGFLRGGGPVLSCGKPPTLVEGRPSDRGEQAAKQPNWKTVEAAALTSAIQVGNTNGVYIAEYSGGILFHHRRQLDDGDLLFLVNTSLESRSKGTLASYPAHGMEVWDLNTGLTTAYPFKMTENGLWASFDLPPAGSLLLFVSRNQRSPAPVLAEQKETLPPVGSPQLRRREPNVMVLDYVDVTAGGQTRTNLYFYRASQFAFQKNGMERNPWDSAVQFRDELITKKFPADSGCEVTYRFTITDKVPAELSVVIERPDLYTITCNGQPLKAKPGAWWLDKAFGCLEIGRMARVGENALTLKAMPFSILHEIEPVYVLGDFGLKPIDKGFVIVPDAGLRLGRWNEQGHPFFSAGVTYVEQFKIASLAGQYRVAMPSWYGSVAKVTVNGKLAGYISSQPWECDVTRQLKRGANTVEVLVIGTLKNTLGPHHAGAGLGSAWPAMFQTGPEIGPPAGVKYATVGYGLF